MNPPPGAPSPGGEDAGKAAGASTALDRKAVNDAVAYIRSLAELRGRNVQWAESAVRQGASLPADEALAGGVVDLVAGDLPDLLRAVDGRKVNGFVANQLIPRMLERGHCVRALARRPRRLEPLPWSKSVEVVAGDVLAPASLRPALQGVHTAYYLIHSMASGRGYTERDLVAARDFAQAAADAGVRHIIYLGALADPQVALAPHLRSRIDTGAMLRRGAVPVTEFRVGVIAGAGSTSLQMIRRVTELLPIIPGNLWLRHKTQPIAAQNAVDR